MGYPEGPSSASGQTFIDNEIKDSGIVDYQVFGGDFPAFDTTVIAKAGEDGAPYTVCDEGEDGHFIGGFNTSCWDGKHSSDMALPDFDDEILFNETLIFEIVGEIDDGLDGDVVVMAGIGIPK